jgi:hypothetical protein
MKKKHKKKKKDNLAPEIRNRIIDHRIVRAGDLVSHELNFRQHGSDQMQALEDILQEVGFARSLLCYELPDGRLKLIDGHGRKALDPDRMVNVEVLDVNESEAAKLLATIDPITGMATNDPKTLKALFASVKSGSSKLNSLWSNLAESCGADKADNLKLNVSGDDDEDLTPEAVVLDPSQVMMMQLFLNGTTHPKMERWILRLNKIWGTKNATEACFKAVRKAFKQERIKHADRKTI